MWVLIATQLTKCKATLLQGYGDTVVGDEESSFTELCVVVKASIHWGFRVKGLGDETKSCPRLALNYSGEKGEELASCCWGALRIHHMTVSTKLQA